MGGEDFLLKFEVVAPVGFGAVWMGFVVIGVHFFFVHGPGASEGGEVCVAEQLAEFVSGFRGLDEAVGAVYDGRGADDDA